MKALAAMPSLKLAPTLQRILTILSDREFHTTDELKTCVNDEDAVNSTFRVHIHRLRLALRRKGQDVACERLGKSSRYRLVDLN